MYCMALDLLISSDDDIYHWTSTYLTNNVSIKDSTLSILFVLFNISVWVGIKFEDKGHRPALGKISCLQWCDVEIVTPLETCATEILK